MADIHGHCDDRFAAVRAQFAQNFDSGEDVGASVAVVKDGELVVDLWGGSMTTVPGNDADTPWQQDTIINVFSTTKTMCNLSALVAADRGLIDLDAPVATYWPEFAANGKAGVLVRHCLSHMAGLQGFDEAMAVEDLYDWEKVCARLAAQAPWWEPGSISGYHGITQGFLVGEIVRRATGKSLGTYFREELAEPLGADFHIGTGPEHDDRIALLIPPSQPAVPETLHESVRARIEADIQLTGHESWTIPWRRAEMPAINGHGNARSVARVQSLVSHGGEIDGRRYISEAGVERIFDQQTRGEPDLAFGVALPIGIGYGLSSPTLPVAPSDKACFWGGWGGSLVVNDVANRMTIAYVMNKMGEGTLGDGRGVGLVYSAYEGLTG